MSFGVIRFLFNGGSRRKLLLQDTRVVVAILAVGGERVENRHHLLEGRAG